MLTGGFRRQAVHRFVRGAERTRRVLAAVVIAERLFRTALHAVADVLSKLTLAVMLPRLIFGVHAAPPAGRNKFSLAARVRSMADVRGLSSRARRSTRIQLRIELFA